MPINIFDWLKSPNTLLCGAQRKRLILLDEGQGRDWKRLQEVTFWVDLEE